MFDKAEIARRRALHPQEWSVVDSWARYVATQDVQVLKDEVASNPDSNEVVKCLLYFAFGDRDLRVLETLAESGVSFQERDDPWSNDSHLCDAVENGGDCPEVVRWLLDRGASPLRCTMNRWTALHFAAIKNYPHVLTELLERGIDVEIGTEIDGNWSPLMKASRAGAVDSVAVLLKYGANPKRRCGMTGESVLESAQRNKHPEIVAMIETAIRDYDKHRGDRGTSQHKE